MKWVPWTDFESLTDAERLQFTAMEEKTLARSIALLKSLQQLDPTWPGIDDVLEWLDELQSSIMPRK